MQETYSDLERKVEERTRDLAQSIHELKVLEEVGRAVASSLDLNAVLPTVAARAMEITHADAVLIYGYRRRRATASTSPRRSASTRMPKAAPRHRPRRLDAWARPPAPASRSRFPICTRPATSPCASRNRGRLQLGAGRAAGRPDRACSARWWCCGGTPATSPANLIGLMQTFAHQAVLAMRNARLFSEVDQKGHELDARALHGAASRRQSCRSRPTSSRTGTSRWRSASRPSSARSSASASSSASSRRRSRN